MTVPDGYHEMVAFNWQDSFGDGDRVSEQTDSTLAHSLLPPLSMGPVALT